MRALTATMMVRMASLVFPRSFAVFSKKKDFAKSRNEILTSDEVAEFFDVMNTFEKSRG